MNIYRFWKWWEWFSQGKIPTEWFFLLRLQRDPNPGSHLSLKIPLDTWSRGVSWFDNLVRHREFGIVATSLYRDEDIGLVNL